MPVPAIVPFLPMIGQAIGQGISAIGGSRQAKKEKEFYEGIQKSGEEQAASLEKQRSNLYGLGPSMRKYLQYAMQDPTADFERQEAQRQSGTAIGALKAGGARSILGGLGAQQQMASSNMARIASDEYKRKTGAMAAVGRVEEGLQDARRMDVNQDLGEARNQAASGLEGAFNAEMMRRQIGNQALAGFAGLAGQAAGIAGQEGLFGEGSIDDATARSMADSANTASQQLELDRLVNQGMSREEAEAILGIGRKGMKTPGKFSHSKNPIDLIQDGMKVGEVTGGEYVINPEQARAIARQSSIARGLFKKFDKQS